MDNSIPPLSPISPQPAGEESQRNSEPQAARAFNRAVVQQSLQQPLQETDFLLAMQLQQQQWQSSQYSPACTEQQLQSVLRGSCEITDAGNSHGAAIINIHAQLVMSFVDNEVPTYRNNDALKSSVGRCLQIAGKFHASDGEQDTLDQIVKKHDFDQVPVNDACFDADTTGDLVQHMFPEVQHGHHEYLLIFHEPITQDQAEYHFISLVASEHGVSVIMPTVAQEDFFTVSTFIEGNISTILLVLCSHFKADEYYAYHRSMQQTASTGQEVQA